MTEENKLDIVSVRLVKDRPLLSDEPVNTPEKAVALLGKFMSEFDRELFCIINMKTDNTPINCSIISIGALDKSEVSVRELMKVAILSNAAKFIAMHNHPSGRVKPSLPDTIVTERLKEVGKIMDIPMVDHIIVGNCDSNSYYSFNAAEEREMPYMRIRYDPEQIIEEKHLFAAENTTAFVR